MTPKTDLHLRRVLLAVVLAWGIGWYARSLWTSEPPPALHGTGLAIIVLNVIAVASVAAGIWLGRAERRRPGRVGWAVPLAVGMAASLALYGLAPDGFGIVLAFVALWTLLTRLPVRRGIATGLTAGLAMLLVVGVLGELFASGPEYGLLSGVVGITLGATASGQRKAAQEEAQRAEAAKAALDERARIAREIHDILAHSLSAQIVHLEGARLLLARDGDRVQALDRVERARRLARSGLEETRRALATLRGDMPSPEQALKELAEEFHTSTGRACEVEVTGTPRELPPEVGLAIVRTAQEALTNVRKHAPGARAHVALRYGEDEVELRVTDSGGTEPPLVSAGGGYGLVGMRERAELAGGTLEAGPDGKGFQVTVRVPA